MPVAAVQRPVPRSPRTMQVRSGKVAPAAPKKPIEDRREELLRRHLQRARDARWSGAAFNEFVLRHEQTNGRIVNGAHHEQWHVDIDQALRLVAWAHVESGKTQQITIGRVLYELGRNPNLRIAIVSETHGKAAKILRSIKTYIRNSAALHEVFPKLKRSSNRENPWTSTAITVERTNDTAKDPSIQVTGAGGSIIGSRVDLLLLDDILSHRNTRTKAQREKLTDWYNSNLGGRLTPTARVIAVGTAWDPEDLYHELAKKPGWVTRRYGVINHDTGELNWPDVWPQDRVDSVRAQLGPIEAARQLDVLPVDSLVSRFKAEFIERALQAGNHYGWAKSAAEIDVPEGAYFTTGIDVGASFRKGGGLTVATTILNHHNGDRDLVCVEAGQMSGPQILELARSHSDRYGSLVFVENNGAQRFLLQFAEQGKHFPVLAFETGANKWHPAYGVESLAIEMSQGRWAFPNVDGSMPQEVAALIAEMKTYSPDAHTGDRIMSMWIAREGARKMAPGMAPQVGVRVMPKVDAVKNDPEEDDTTQWGE